MDKIALKTNQNNQIYSSAYSELKIFGKSSAASPIHFDVIYKEGDEGNKRKW